jgi:hypothetical protein
MASNKCSKEECSTGNKNCKTGKCKKATAEPAGAALAASSVSVLAAKAAGVTIASRASAISAQQKPAVAGQPAAEVISNPSEAIRDTAANFHKLYSQYTALRALAKPLNGLPQSNPFPDNIKIKNVIVAFTVDGSEEQTAEISSPRFIGEIAALMGNELRSLIERMYQELFALEHVTSGMQKAVQQAIASANKPENGVTLKAAADSSLANDTEQSNEEETQSD